MKKDWDCYDIELGSVLKDVRDDSLWVVYDYNNCEDDYYATQYIIPIEKYNEMKENMDYIDLEVINIFDFSKEIDHEDTINYVLEEETVTLYKETNIHFV